MKKLFTLLLLIIGIGVNAQEFEQAVMPGEFLNNSSPDAGFVFNNIFYPNDYNPDFDFWTGWAISATTDVTTPGFMNQYSAIVGEGANGSSAYAVSFASPESYVVLDSHEDMGSFVDISSVYITNSTYAYLSMRDGDDFAKKFGGETGNDPDFFLLTIKTYSNNELQDSIPFYLADFRFEDNSQDYILDEWVEIDFPSIADSVTFSLSSSDNGMFGMNTPAYFCADAFDGAIVLNVENNELAGISLTNTLVSSELTINSGLDQKANYQVFGLSGQVVKEGVINQDEQYIYAEDLPTGKYWIQVRQDGLQWTQGFVKQ